jgi:homospermidine synthase
MIPRLHSASQMKHRRILFVGYGTVAQALTPVLFTQYPDLDPHNVSVITADERGAGVARSFGIGFRVTPLTQDNLDAALDGRLGRGDILLNLSVDVATVALIDWCQSHDVLYLDTCVEPWAGGYDADRHPIAHTTNYWLRQEALRRRGKGKSTCVIAHGANPGLVSHFVKLALCELALREGLAPDAAPSALAGALGVKAIQIAERDTQTDCTPLRAGEFANTWSVDGLMAEAKQHAELSWGTHETRLPPGAAYIGDVPTAGVMLDGCGVRTQVKSWVPSVGNQRAWLITHHEAHSIGDCLTTYSPDGAMVHRPTVYYAYRPAPKTCESLARWGNDGLAPPARKTVMVDSLVSGADELGVLLIREKGAYWFGSVLSLVEARRIAPHNNATTMQVVGGIVGALAWMLSHPMAGVVEAEDMDADCVMRVARPFLGQLVGLDVRWPADGRPGLQMQNFWESE